MTDAECEEFHRGCRQLALEFDLENVGAQLIHEPPPAGWSEDRPCPRVRRVLTQVQIEAAEQALDEFRSKLDSP